MKSLMYLLLLVGSWQVAAADMLPDQSLIQRGQAIATAADCGACHRDSAKNGAPFAGGYAINSPMGPIIASNITPSEQFGIGGYTERQFADALRKGRAADGHFLYPAMPYTAFQGMTDDDVHALYLYFMYGVKPVDRAPAAKTHLSFPFNIRQLMWGWNLLYLHHRSIQRPEALSEKLQRGRYLVDVLGHCSTCHTPRNILMAEDQSRYLSGGLPGGWYAPNITPDPSGLADWSQSDIVTYLKTGHVAGKGQAAGPMGEAVEQSFRYLPDDDLHAIAAWIRQIPAIPGRQAKSGIRPPVEDINRIIKGQGDQASLADSSSTDGAALYSNACASCHGRQGMGTADSFYPSLTRNSAVSAASPGNVVMAVVNGVHRRGSDAEVFMPAFASQMNDAQIAAVSGYIRLHFAGIDTPLTAADVHMLRSGGEPPFLLRYLYWLIAGGVIVLLLVISGLLSLRRR
ncbi:c-type cytochrome [Erwinia sorbitola]|uniref:C-type cytochrome n=1 Tax=Erwinia sorbitola TaxID=2681984 RepID=A0ABW9RFS0_9GAMM|nr:c-type cytochrome [Erwinia sorbitola]MTD29058.1 c-type cytochrome [Erwinia sorbitola]